MTAPATMLSAPRLALLTDEIRALGDLPGALAELGVCRGGAAWAMHRAAPSRRLHLFDTFAGLPDPDPAVDVHPAGRFAASAAEVLWHFTGAPVTLHVGRFPDSVHGLTLPPLAFVHVDGDLYETTRAALAVLWPRVVPGGVMVFDDYGLCDCPGVKRALDESGHAVEVRNGIQAVLRRAA